MPTQTDSPMESKAPTKNEAGHMLLARLGKKRLRPGGRIATNWLIGQAHLRPDTRILEVACNMGTTAIELARRYGCSIIGVDLNEAALAKARNNAKAAGVADKVLFERANARDLPFDDASFDVVINEAMLTMQNEEGKHKAVQEYFRVLKPGGYLLTHDLALHCDGQVKEDLIAQLREAIRVKATPLTDGEWRALFSASGFKVTTFTGAMTLLSPLGMVRDEGLFGAIRIARNAMRSENRAQFMRMFRLFRRARDQFGFLAACSRKPL